MLQTGSIRGDFPSLKLGRMVRYTSTIERDLLYFLEYRKSVRWYEEQPMTIEWQQADGPLRHYTPDYEIHESDIKYLAECKPVEKLNAAHAQQQREIGKAWCEANHYQFVTYTDTELRAGHELENLKLFWRYARLKHTSSMHEHILRITNLHTFITISELSQMLGMALEAMVPNVCCLLFHQELYMDMNKPFSVTATVWQKEQDHGAD